MKSQNTLKHHLIVWSVIVTLLAAVTVLVVNIDHLRDSLSGKGDSKEAAVRLVPDSD